MQVTDDKGQPVEQRHAIALADETPRMALDVDKADYRVRANAPEFWHDGELLRPGDVRAFEPVHARAAAQWIETLDGKAIPMEGQQVGTSAIPRANLAGMARHERIGALQAERDALKTRLARVDAQLATEEDAQAEALKSATESDPMAAKVLTTTESVPARTRDDSVESMPAREGSSR